MERLKLDYRAVKFCTHVGYIKSQCMEDKSPLKGSRLRDSYNRTTLCQRGICCCRVSDRLSVRPSVTRRYCTKKAKHKITIAQGFEFSDVETLGKFPMGNPQRGRQKRWDRLKRRFSTNISLYLRNGVRQGHSYYGTLIETYVLYRLVLFPVTSVTLTTQITQFSTFCIFVVSGVRDLKFGSQVDGSKC